MTIVIKNEDSSSKIKEKLAEAEKMSEDLRKQEILELYGILKGKLTGDPVESIRKIRDEEWS